MFTSEEPTRFGLSCSGSRAMAGALTAEELDSKLDVNGSTFLQASGRLVGNCGDGMRWCTSTARSLPSDAVCVTHSSIGCLMGPCAGRS
jgi:hypothetical protein